MSAATVAASAVAIEVASAVAIEVAFVAAVGVSAVIAKAAADFVATGARVLTARAEDSGAPVAPEVIATTRARPGQPPARRLNNG